MKITVIGGGPGGYEAAIYAAKLGAEVTLIEKDKVGGTCLNKGCIPTKALLAVTDVLDKVKTANKFGISLGEIQKDFKFAVERKNKVVYQLNSGIEYLLKKNKVNYISGFGKIKNAKTVEVIKDGAVEEIDTDYIILATGSVVSAPSFFKYDGNRVISSDEVLSLQEAPKSIIIVGGGVVGCEFGQFLSKMGTDVTIVESMEQLLPNEDKDVANLLQRQFKKDKIKVKCGNVITEVNISDSGVKATLKDSNVIEAEYMLVSVGRKPFTEGLGIENINLTLDKNGTIPVNEFLQTEIENVYAVGDIINTPQLAHVASKEGITAVENIFGKGKKINYNAVPRCIYTTPEIACVGKTELELKKDEISYKIGTFPYMALGKAKATDKTDGFVKVIVDDEDTIIGAGIVGAHSTDMLQLLTVAVELKLKAEQLGNSIFPHPTLSEGIMEAIHDIHGMSIHK